MSELRFSVGDRVMATESPADSLEIQPGWCGTVVAVDVGSFDYAVEWDDEFDGGYEVSYSGKYVTSDLHGWCVNDTILAYEPEDDADALCAISEETVNSFLSM